MQQRTRLIGAGLLIATGLVWVGQGTGLLRGNSFMVGDATWAWIGVAAVASGIFVGWLAFRSPTR
ncbi:MAG TPA: hypothetical protein VGO64_04345 [Candidatus Limnocylindrales bacterium]|jgi:uncharacterized protein YaaW (UPF0174 family)|nr:hypothetical protein [Candidatus Limnocylindrales bacterium]